MYSRTDSSAYHDTERNVQGGACTYDSFPCATAGCDGRVEYPCDFCEECQLEHDNLELVSPGGNHATDL